MNTNISKRRSLALLAAFLMFTAFATEFLLAEPAMAKGKSGPVKKGGTLYFYKNGKPAKAGRERREKYGKNYYYVLKSGKIRKGWNVLGDDLYYFGGRNGAMVKSHTVKGITLLPNGKAEKSRKNKKGKKVVSLNASIHIKCIKALKKRGAYNKSKSGQLRAAWTYLTDRKTFSYEKFYPNLKDSQWTKKYADRMLSRKKGNCYGYACTFAAFAYTIGYDPYVVAGRCPGSRDHAGDGFTRHCITKINGRWYDPEYWAIYRSHYLYGAKSTSYTFKDRKKAVRFKTVKGNLPSSVKTISGNLKKIGKEYYYLTSSGSSRDGTYYIKKKLYNFNKKGKYGKCTVASDIKKLNRAAKKGKPYSGLTKIIGKTKKYNNECDEYNSITYLHKNIYVNTRKDEEGKDVIYEIGNIKDIQL